MSSYLQCTVPSSGYSAILGLNCPVFKPIYLTMKQIEDVRATGFVVNILEPEVVTTPIDVVATDPIETAEVVKEVVIPVEETVETETEVVIPVEETITTEPTATVEFVKSSNDEVKLMGYNDLKVYAKRLNDTFEGTAIVVGGSKSALIDAIIKVNDLI